MKKSWKIYRDISGTEYWYDTHCRCWFTALVDAEGNIGPSENAYTKKQIRKCAKAIVQTTEAIK